MGNVTHIGELEKKLEEAGHGIGLRLLKFVHTSVWKCLFNKAADSLEQGNDADDEFMISDRVLLVNRFISVPKDMGQPVPGSNHPKTTILMKFDAATMQREQ